MICGCFIHRHSYLTGSTSYSPVTLVSATDRWFLLPPSLNELAKCVFRIQDVPLPQRERDPEASRRASSLRQKQNQPLSLSRKSLFDYISTLSHSHIWLAAMGTRTDGVFYVKPYYFLSIHCNLCQRHPTFGIAPTAGRQVTI